VYDGRCADQERHARLLYESQPATDGGLRHE